MRDLEDALATYLQVLSESAAQTHRAEDRPRYQSHLAHGARMFAALRGKTPVESIKAIVAAERHSYGWSHLSDDAGKRAEAAFNHFASLVENI